ncbi:uroporphyrinogen-III synthase [Gilvimarinus sp. F26214L]|uniref:uroporphyrinogen-III synthase n=1 Tax=Gilvimarinus sp. DZF01 TaxID=3461371 RepID=UPI004045ADAA
MDLQGLDVVITRPAAQARQWEQDLRKRGASTFLLPVMEIEAVRTAAEREAVKRCILNLAEYQKVIFVSRNAVAEAMEWVDRYWPQNPVGIQYFAVGSATARAAEARGLTVHAADQAMNSEALLELEGLKTVADAKVLIFRGVGGRSFLAEQLRARGAQVDFCELYHRRLPAEAAARFSDLLERWRQPPEATGPERAVAVHSGESLLNFNQLLEGGAPAEFRTRLLEQVMIVVPGARVAELASELGFGRILVALNATDESMAEALSRGLSSPTT